MGQCDPPDSAARNEAQQPREVSYVRRVLIGAAISIGMLISLLVLWYARQTILLVFAGILLAVFLRGLSDLLSKRTGLSTGWALAAVVVALLGLGGLTGWLLTPTIIAQANELATTLPQAAEQLQAQVESYALGEQLVEGAPLIGDGDGDSERIIKWAPRIFSGTLDAVTSIAIVLVIGLYLAADPQVYCRGIQHLVPQRARRRTREVLDTLGHTLRSWLLAQFFAMIVVGGLMTLGYWLLGIPLALVLGLLAGLLGFIPIVGPILAALPAMLLALVSSPIEALYVLILYLVVQGVESYVLTPLVQQYAVDLPPVVTTVSLVVFGTFFGFLGLLLATPIAAVLLVLVKMLYVEDVLGDRSVEVQGEDRARDPHG